MFSVPILGVIAGYIWIVEPVAPRWVQPVPTVVVLGLSAWRAKITGEWGLRGSAFLPALGWSLLLTIPASAALLGAGWFLGTLHERGNPWRDLAYLTLWGGGQQFALQTVLLREAQSISSRRAGIWLSAAVFGALHLPNPFLAPLTFVGALAWCWIYDRFPNVLPPALSHALVTLAILRAFDDRITGRLRVGAAYLRLY